MFLPSKKTFTHAHIWIQVGRWTWYPGLLVQNLRGSRSAAWVTCSRSLVRSITTNQLSPLATNASYERMTIACIETDTTTLMTVSPSHITRYIEYDVYYERERYMYISIHPSILATELEKVWCECALEVTTTCHACLTRTVPVCTFGLMDHAWMFLIS